MAGVLEYALSLKTAGFDNPLKVSEKKLSEFDTAAKGSNSTLSGLTAAAAGATAAFAAFAGVTAGALKVLGSYAEFDGLVRGMKTLEGTAEGTRSRIELLRDVAKVPGLGFEEAVRGDIRLRAVGISADLSEQALRAFGNAIATVGGGKSDLDGVILALGQMESKGKIAAEEINQINERVPQVRAAMKAAFGTADSEALVKAGVTSTQFIEGLVAELGKLPAVTGGARNALDNYDDSWKALKNTAAEFAVNIAGDWVNAVSGAFQTARRDLQSLQELFGVQTPGLLGPDGAGADIQAYRKRKAEEAAADKKAADEKTALEKANADFWYTKGEERRAFEEDRAARRVETEKKAAAEIIAAGEKYAQAKLTEEEFLTQKINALRRTGPTSKADVDRLPANSEAQKDAAKSLAELATLERQLADLKQRGADADKAKSEQAARKAESAAKELTAQQQASALFNADNAILAARISGNDKLVKQLERQAAVERLKLDLMRTQGLTEKQAAEAAEKRIALEERANGTTRRGILSQAAAAAEKADRSKLAADGNKRPRGNSDRLALADLERRGNRPLSPARAAELLARGGAAADPGKVRREERAALVLKPDEKMLKEVRDIKTTFSKIARA